MDEGKPLPPGLPAAARRQRVPRAVPGRRAGGASRCHVIHHGEHRNATSSTTGSIAMPRHQPHSVPLLATSSGIRRREHRDATSCTTWCTGARHIIGGTAQSKTQNTCTCSRRAQCTPLPVGIVLELGNHHHDVRLALAAGSLRRSTRTESEQQTYLQGEYAHAQTWFVMANRSPEHCMSIYPRPCNWPDLGLLFS